MANDDQASEHRQSTVDRRKFLIGGSAAALTLPIAGCGGDGDGGDATPTEGDGDTPTEGDGDTPTEGGDTDTPTEGGDTPEKPDSITVRAWGGNWQESVNQSIAQRYTEETGIEVEFDNTDRTTMQGQIRTAIQQDREPPVNVMWTVVSAAHTEYAQGLADPLDPSIVTNIDQMFDLATPDVDGNPPYLSMYSYTYPLCYNEEELESVQGDSEPVSAWADLKDDTYQDNLGVYDNGYGLHPVLAAMSGTDLSGGDFEPMWDELRELEPTIGVVGDDTNLAESIRQGEVAYAQLITSNIVDAVRSDDEPLGWTVPEEGATAKQDSMYTPKNQSEGERYWSQVFINYAASEESQNDWVETLSLPMLNQNVEAPEWMQEDPAYPTSQEEIDALLSPDPSLYVEHQSTWFDQFNQIISG